MTTKRGGVVLGPRVKGRCRWCGEPVANGRRSWCSPACVEDFRIRAWPGYVRRPLAERDRGVCGSCGWDTKKFRRIMMWAADGLSPREGCGRYPWAQSLRPVADLLHQVGIDWHRQTFWDADHMVPVEDGGGACGLDNYQTLCIPCHKSKTAEQAAQKAKRRQRQGV
jgi:hypothetical protein